MGKVIVKIKLTNLKDAFLKAAGARKAKPREVEVEALVDTEASRRGFRANAGAGATPSGAYAAAAPTPQ